MPTPLSAAAVKACKREGLHWVSRGLYLQIDRGVRSWLFRYQISGRRRQMGLGPCRDVTLAQAREAADQARALVRLGIDPIEERKRRGAAERGQRTFRQAAEKFIAARAAEWSNAKHRLQWPSTLETYAYPVIGDVLVAAIEAEHVLQVLAPVWETKTETASRVRQRIEAVLDYARVRGWRAGDNPAKWRGNLEHTLAAKKKVAKVKHHASLPYGDMPGFLPRLQAWNGFAARALEWQILTGVRPGEAVGARWDEVDIDGRLWVLPAKRMKARTEHRVPLSEPALALLRRMQTVRCSEYVFPGGRHGAPLSDMAMRNLLRRMGVPATPHGFRSTFRTWAAEESNSPADICEVALAHTQSGLMQAYQRGDLLEKRRRLMNAWAGYITGAGSADVVPLGRVW